MPQRTSKILLVRLTATKNALYFKYALRVLLVTLCDLALRVVIKMQWKTTLHSLQLRTLTGFHFTHEWKHRLESFLLTVIPFLIDWNLVRKIDVKPEVQDKIRKQLYECAWVKSSGQKSQNFILMLFTHFSAIYSYEFSKCVVCSLLLSLTI